MRELSFSEFLAVRRRHSEPEPPKEEVGTFTETLEVQVAMLCLIIADLAAAALATSVRVAVVESFAGFTIFVFLFELLALAYAFRGKFLAHPGYALDMVVVGLFLDAEVKGQRGLRFLGFLRLWRIARLVDTVGNDTKVALDKVHQEQERALKLDVERSRLEAALDEANAARSRLATMTRAYKDEIDTLNEALAIAAMDIAEDTDDADDDKEAPTTFVIDASGAFTSS